MFNYTIGLQGRGREHVVINTIAAGARVGDFERLRAAYAYASSGGALDLIGALRSSIENWDGVEKKWLISFDFGHSDPRALDLLASLPASEVRVPYAAEVLANRRLIPRTTFHPKTLILDSPGHLAAPVMVAMGSANMTVSGLRTGHEDVAVATWGGGRLRTAERAQRDAMLAEAAWFDRVWRRATRLTPGLLGAYRIARPISSNPEDRSQPVRDIEGLRIVDFEQAATLGASSRLWVEVHNVAENLGQGRPGNQLHLRRGTRIFFGLTPKRVPKMTALGSIDLIYSGRTTQRNMRYSHNGMDTLDLPLPGVDGPPGYDHTVLLFKRITTDSFSVRVGSVAQVTRWKDASQAAGTRFQLSGGREWGVLP